MITDHRRRAPPQVLSPRLSSGFFGGDADFVHQMVAGDANAKRPLPKLEVGAHRRLWSESS